MLTNIQTAYTLSHMSKAEKVKKSAIISFRAEDEVKQRIDREAKKRKQTRADFVAAVFFSAFDIVSPAPSKQQL